MAMARSHPRSGKRFVEPQDLARETLITYPVVTERLDVFHHFLQPAGVQSLWLSVDALARKQIVALRLGKSGLWSTLYAGNRAADRELVAYLNAFIETALHTLTDIRSV